MSKDAHPSPFVAAVQRVRGKARARTPPRFKAFDRRMAREPVRPAGPVPTIARDESSGAAGASSVTMRSPSPAWKPATRMRVDWRQTSRHRHPNRRSRAPTAAVAATAATSKEPTAAKAACPPATDAAPGAASKTGRSHQNTYRQPVYVKLRKQDEK